VVAHCCAIEKSDPGIQSCNRRLCGLATTCRVMYLSLKTANISCLEVHLLSRHKPLLNSGVAELGGGV
jgi:hypothetical protein